MLEVSVIQIAMSILPALAAMGLCAGMESMPTPASVWLDTKAGTVTWNWKKGAVCLKDIGRYTCMYPQEYSGVNSELVPCVRMLLGLTSVTLHLDFLENHIQF
ncbi:rCG28590 [Rattus norvegicus]|uniref:RCG28590 n=1 Tax=Rattus norvegicus TaxID=10116 RepID=A6HW83_RAT|nr:rCG28590 [Rattus norvegicus]